MIKLFFSYSHVDEVLRDQLEIHLTMLKRNGLVQSWHDRRIDAGSELDREISHHLEAADVILLLLSPHFLASDYCYEREAQRALDRHNAQEAIVIPVILQPCDWQSSPFKKLRATPRDGKPVVMFPNINEAFLQVTQDIRRAAESLHKDESSAMAPAAPAVNMSHASADLRSSNLRVKKAFTDREKDVFTDDAFAYIEKFFENSLAELRGRNQGLDVRFKKLSATGFICAIYVAGNKRTSCHIWLGGRRSFAGDIAFAANDSTETNSVNDGLRVEDDGYQLGLKPNGMSFMRQQNDALLTPQGAAEYLWSTFISPLQ